MRSTHADAFNHDAWAATYDRSVADESDPIREGYREALAWIGTVMARRRSILDLGTGTGNTIAVLPAGARVVAVDVSRKMLAIARRKLAGRSVDYVERDLLEYVNEPDHGRFDGIVSSYAIHHLTESEKGRLLTEMKGLLRRGGRIAIVDLMYEDEAHRSALLRKYRRADPETAESIAEEFFWDIAKTKRLLDDLGCRWSMKRFSQLSWGMTLAWSGSPVSRAKRRRARRDGASHGG